MKAGREYAGYVGRLKRKKDRIRAYRVVGQDSADSAESSLLA